MKRIAGLVLILALSACGVTGPVPPPGTPGIMNCSDAALHDAELRILPSVENALASANWEQALLTIVAGIAAPLALQEVNCVVAWVQSEATKQSISTADSLEATKESNAAAWLSKHPANITGAMGAP